MNNANNTETETETITVGTRVEAGKPGTEDYDTGVVLEVGDDGHVKVGWDSGVKTWDVPSRLCALD